MSNLKTYCSQENASRPSIFMNFYKSDLSSNLGWPSEDVRVSSCYANARRYDAVEWSWKAPVALTQSQWVTWDICFKVTLNSKSIKMFYSKWAARLPVFWCLKAKKVRFSTTYWSESRLQEMLTLDRCLCEREVLFDFSKNLCDNNKYYRTGEKAKLKNSET